MCLELMLNAANLTLVAFSRFNVGANGLPNYNAQVLVFFIITVAAAEVAVGLAIIVALFRARADDARRGPQLAEVLRHGSAARLVHPLPPLVAAVLVHLLLAQVAGHERRSSPCCRRVLRPASRRSESGFLRRSAMVRRSSSRCRGSISGRRCACPIGLIARSPEPRDAARRHRRRRAHPHLLARLHGATTGRGALLREPVALHVLDARHRAREQLRDDVHLLGTGRRLAATCSSATGSRATRPPTRRRRRSSPTASATSASCSAS